jgi:phage terminase large subunit-like protein
MPDISTFTEEERRLALEQRQLLLAIEQARKYRKMDSFFLATGPFRREFYGKHIHFFTAGGQHAPMAECPPGCDGSPHRERCLLAANRTGKTVAAAYEVTCHATGLYPEWWPGGRFKEPILAWVSNDTNTNTRDINQLELLGRAGMHGTGMIPAELIVKTTPKPGIPDAVETITVKHTSGGTSVIQFKSYEQGWEKFTGGAVHVIWCDEEPDTRVYTECCIRTMTTHGLVLLTFTPLQGVTEVVRGFIDSYNTTSEKEGK